jgi:hypothetical protein
VTHEQAWSRTRWTAEIAALLEDARREGNELEGLQEIEHTVCVRTRGEADALARDLASAHYRINFVQEDSDYRRWEVIVTEALERPDLSSVLAAQDRLRGLVHKRDGVISGIGIGVGR